MIIRKDVLYHCYSKTYYLPTKVGGVTSWIYSCLHGCDVFVEPLYIHYPESKSDSAAQSRRQVAIVEPIIDELFQTQLLPGCLDWSVGGYAYCSGDYC